MFTYERAVRFEEVDGAGLVFFARFFSYCHEAVEALCGELDGGYARLIGDRKTGLPAVHVACDFKSPLRYGDVAVIHLSVRRIGRSSCELHCTINKGESGVVSAEVDYIVAACDLTSMKPIPIPDDLRRLFTSRSVGAG